MTQNTNFCDLFDKFRFFLIGFLLLIFGMFCTKNLVHAASFSNVEIGKFTYDLNEKTQTATVKKYNPGIWDKLSGSYDITIPETVKYKNKKYNVTTVNRSAFSGDKKINKVTGNSITDILSNSFYNCGNLKEISLPKATNIGTSAFEYCSKLEKVNLPEATNIGGYAFGHCTSLTTISLPEATNIGNCAFNSCNKLETISLPKATNIGGYAFCDCTSLTTISLPEATYVGSYAFCDCTSLTTISLPEATNIGGNCAFKSCNKLETISLPKATNIGGYAFCDCTSLTTISLPEATNIGTSAFEDCTSLTTISLPKATNIGTSAFEDCTSLTTISLPEATYVGSYAFTSCNKLETIYFPKATDIGNYAFRHAGNLKSVSIPNAISIGSGAFYECQQLNSVFLPKAIYIGDCAFYKCKNLQEVNISNAIRIDDQAFNLCDKLTSISLPEATYIGYFGFGDCPALKEISIPNVSFIGKYAFRGCKFTQLVLPKVSYIGDYAFALCNNLTKLQAPNLVYYNDNSLGKSNIIFYLPKIMQNYSVKLPNNISKNYIDNKPNIEALVDKDNLDAKIREVKNNLSAKYNNLTIYSEKLGDYKSDQYKNSRYYAVRFYPANRKDGVENNFTDKVLLLLAADININVPNTQFVYNKKEHKADIIITDGNYSLQEGIDYNLKYDDNLVDVGTKSITLEFIGDYEGLESKTCTYKIIADKSSWGKIVSYNKIINYIDESGRTSAEITGNEMVWIKETSDGTSAWYAIDNSNGIFKQGSRFWVKWLSPENNKEEFEKYYNILDEKHKKQVENNKLWIFLTGVTDPDGNEYTNLNEKIVNYYIQIGEDWDKRDIKAIFIDEYSDSVLEVSYENLKFPEGDAEFAKLSMNHFSPYAIYDSYDSYNNYDNSNKQSISNINSGIIPRISVLSLIILISISSVVIFNKFKFKKSE